MSVVHRSLLRHGFNAGALHGDMDQHARMATLDAFRKGEITLLVASDVAARGLDIPEVSHIYNYDVPTHADDYVHRIGRTGRAGRAGTTLMLVTPAETKYVAAINKLTNLDIPWHGEAVSEEAGGKRERRAPKRGRRGEPGRAAKEAAPAAKETPREEKPQAEKPKQEPKPSKAGKPEKKHAEKHGEKPREKEKKRGKEPRKRGGKEGPVVGLGDHVPAFLLRPVRTDRD